MSNDDDDTYEIPLQDQRIFGAGIKRQRVKFVPSSTLSDTTVLPRSQATQSIGDLYLQLVLPQDIPESRPAQSVCQENISTTDLKPPAGVNQDASSQICAVCNLPLTTEQNAISICEGDFSSKLSTWKERPHEASLAHQVCLSHSHPPSHLDRNRKGLAYLSSYGWDPDARLGLGAFGQGIQYPIKPKPKDDKLGIGVVLPKDIERMRKVKPVKLDAGKVRKMHEKDKKRNERLREMFYRNDDVERYLGGG